MRFFFFFHLIRSYHSILERGLFSSTQPPLSNCDSFIYMSQVQRLTPNFYFLFPHRENTKTPNQRLPLRKPP